MSLTWWKVLERPDILLLAKGQNKPEHSNISSKLNKPIHIPLMLNNHNLYLYQHNFNVVPLYYLYFSNSFRVVPLFVGNRYQQCRGFRRFRSAVLLHKCDEDRAPLGVLVWYVSDFKLLARLPSFSSFYRPPGTRYLSQHGGRAEEVTTVSIIYHHQKPSICEEGPCVYIICTEGFLIIIYFGSSLDLIFLLIIINTNAPNNFFRSVKLITRNSLQFDNSPNFNHLYCVRTCIETDPFKVSISVRAYYAEREIYHLRFFILLSAHTHTCFVGTSEIYLIWLTSRLPAILLHHIKYTIEYGFS